MSRPRVGTVGRVSVLGEGMVRSVLGACDIITVR